MKKTIKTLILAAAVTTSLSVVAKADPIYSNPYLYNVGYNPAYNWHGMSVASMTHDRSSENVANIQQSLASLGYNIGRFGVTGHLNSSTTRAIKQFQADNGIKRDGFVGFSTADALNNSAFRYRGVAPANYSNNMTVIQGELQELGFNVGQNGVYDAPTAHAISAFQAQNGLNVSGIADQSTVNAMNSEVTSKRSYNVNYIAPNWRGTTAGMVPISY